MITLGIHDGHNSSAALYIDGEIAAAIQEERLRYEKNWTGYPTKAVEWVLKYTNNVPNQVDAVIFNGHHMPRDLSKTELIAAHKLRWGFKSWFKCLLKQGVIGRLYTKRRQYERIGNAVQSGFIESKMHFVEHHECHASAAYHGWGKYDEPVLVLTCDGAGDRICASINIGNNGKLERIGAVPEAESIGCLYACITTVMGFVPLEHEYKLMGMAPYAEEKYTNEVADIFRSHFSFDSNNILIWHRKESTPPPYYGYWYWRKQLEGKRFDSIMGGLQRFVEEFISQWVRNCVKHTGINSVSLSGGFFMNVKANKVIMDLEEIENLFIFPSCGDEMNAIGACYAFESANGSPSEILPISDIYWGPSYTNNEVEIRLRKYNRKQEVSVEKIGSEINKKVAQLLSDGEVVARFCGREEMGARSLGNRAILANPSDMHVITEINKMIKKRDFWMPFASSIKRERRHEYLVNTKDIDSPYMILTFDTTKDGKNKLKAGTHPQDNTIRPQEVCKESNSEYWDMINEFELLTGQGGILNTSFNLHGYPIVNTPEQALNVLLDSGLKYLQIEGYLIRKI